MIRAFVIIVAVVQACLRTVEAEWLEAIGYDRLSASLVGGTMPEGRGIAMTQVEATSAGGGHLPQNGKGRYDGVEGFVGKAFHAHSGRSPVSQHARIVGHYLYASEPLDSFGAVSLSPSVAEID